MSDSTILSQIRADIRDLQGNVTRLGRQTNEINIKLDKIVDTLRFIKDRMAVDRIRREAAAPPPTPGV